MFCMAEQPLITKEMTIGETIEQYPQVAMVLMNHGLHCIGCHVAAWETIEEGCKVHGMEDEHIDKMVEEANAVALEHSKNSDKK